MVASCMFSLPCQQIQINGPVVRKTCEIPHEKQSARKLACEDFHAKRSLYDPLERTFPAPGRWEPSFRSKPAGRRRSQSSCKTKDDTTNGGDHTLTTQKSSRARSPCRATHGVAPTRTNFLTLESPNLQPNRTLKALQMGKIELGGQSDKV